MLSQEERTMIAGLFPFLSKEPIIFDIGSNKGHFSDLFLDEYKDDCMLFLFEPNEKLLSFTQIKYEYQKNIIYEGLAAYKANGEINFNYFENFNNELSSIYEDLSWKGMPMKTKKVISVTIDSYCKLNKIESIDYLKIDCEGADVDVLSGSQELMKEGNVKIIQIEYSEHYERAGKSMKDVFEIAKKYGYSVYNFIEGNYWEIKDVWSLMKPDNYILTKEEIHNYSVGGWNDRFVINTAELPKMNLCLEIGAFEGLTTKYMCEKMLEDGGRIVVIDPLLEYYIEGDMDHPYFKGQYPRFIRNSRGLPIELKRGKSIDELPKLNALRFDFVYIDGDHRKDAVYFDLVWSFAICKNGGHILIDDYTWRTDTTEGVDKFLNEFSASFELILKDYQVMIKKVHNQYNELTFDYYK